MTSFPQSLRDELEKRAPKSAFYDGLIDSGWMAGAEACFELLSAELKTRGERIEELNDLLAGYMCCYCWQENVGPCQCKAESELTARDTRIADLEADVEFYKNEMTEEAGRAFLEEKQRSRRLLEALRTSGIYAVNCSECDGGENIIEQLNQAIEEYEKAGGV